MSGLQSELLRAEAIRNLETYRVGRRHVIIMMIIIGLLDVMGIVYLVRGPGLPEGLWPTEAPAANDLLERVGPEPEPEPELRDPDAREVEFTHYVRWGDTFYMLSRRYWGDEHLWPDLWSLNRERYPDPDFIAERDVVAVYPRLAPDGEFQEAELDRLFQAYLEAYRAYQRVGDDLIAESRRTGRSWQRRLGRIKRHKSKWLLYSALRFDEGYLERYQEKIDSADLKIVKNYIERFGTPGRR